MKKRERKENERGEEEDDDDDAQLGASFSPLLYRERWWWPHAARLQSLESGEKSLLCCSHPPPFPSKSDDILLRIRTMWRRGTATALPILKEEEKRKSKWGCNELRAMFSILKHYIQVHVPNVALHFLPKMMRVL